MAGPWLRLLNMNIGIWKKSDLNEEILNIH